MQPDLAKLRTVMRDEASVRSLFTLLPQVRLRANVTSVKNLARVATSGRSAESAYALVYQALRLLEACGFGRLLDPTLRTRARFLWAIHPATVADIARDAHATFQPHHLLQAGARLEGPPEIPAGWQARRFELRPGGTATLILPADLNAGEARRLGHYLLSLASDA